MSYIEGLGYVPETEPTSEQTTAEQTEVTSSVEDGQTTAKDDEQSTADDLVPEPAVKNGCGSVVGFGAATVVAVVSVVGAVAFRKKED